MSVIQEFINVKDKNVCGQLNYCLVFKLYICNENICFSVANYKYIHLIHKLFFNENKFLSN